MESYLPENEYKEVEGRAYLNPQVAVDESNAFIDNLRASQNRQNQEIATDTQRLGTNVPSDLGGLVGADSYFASRYQTPQTNSVVANLRAAAQANALNQILQDERAMWKKKYQDTYRDYQKRQYRKAYGGGSGGGSGGGNGGNTSTWDGEIEDVVTDGSGGLTAVGSLSLDANDMAAGGKYIVEPGSGNIIRVDDSLNINDPNYQQTFYQKADGSYATRNGKNRLSGQSGLVNNAPLASALRSKL